MFRNATAFPNTNGILTKQLMQKSPNIKRNFPGSGKKHLKRKRIMN